MILTNEKLHPIPFTNIPAGFQIEALQDVKAYYEQITSTAPQNATELITLMEKSSDISAALSDELSWRYIRMTCHADDETFEKAYNDFYSNIFAPTEPYRFEVQKLFYESPYRDDLDPELYLHLEQIISNEIQLYREENIPIKIQESELANRYGGSVSKMTAMIDGQEKTVSQLSVYMHEQDRAKREEAWRLRMGCYADRQVDLDALFDELRNLRNQITANTGFDNYRDYMHKSMGRFSYTPDDLLQFHDSVATVVVPFIKELNQHRQSVLGVESLRPWDTTVDLDGIQLKPFETTAEFIDKAIIILNKINPRYALQLEMMNNTGLLDLENHKGKAPGGYNTGINNLASSFIFMNHVKLHNDVVTLLHEAGHAMHSTAVKDITIDFYREPPSEVAELASMTMELLSMDYWNEYYPNAADFKKAKKDQLIGTLSFLPWCMNVDAFQHWIYLHPIHTPAERAQAFVEINNRFSSGIDWSDLEEYHKILWMSQLHIFEVPFYYIEYGMAQLGALSIYMNYRKNPEQALKAYDEFLNLGYSKPVSELYLAAGIKFDFSEERIRELVEFVRSEIENL
ncbi:MAG: M3 family oligoendopeptidase [Candidatus Cloacimonetes bacterium HGW-Cloacimonetes-1]|jgi:oligoendopeptidase F|nr:MAG: M3 family oligoendopeptidase [Candidatus Cloacimonetes bacterium HGW-Cloacimonetes-1]